MVDTPGLGPGARKSMEVQVLSRPPELSTTFYSETAAASRATVSSFTVGSILYPIASEPCNGDPRSSNYEAIFLSSW